MMPAGASRLAKAISKTSPPSRSMRLSLTCSAIVGMTNLICCVPELRKARAVRDTIAGPISTACPASILRTHPRAQLFLDAESASLLEV